MTTPARTDTQAFLGRQDLAEWVLHDGRVIRPWVLEEIGLLLAECAALTQQRDDARAEIARVEALREEERIAWTAIESTLLAEVARLTAAHEQRTEATPVAWAVRNSEGRMWGLACLEATARTNATSMKQSVVALYEHPAVVPSSTETEP